MHAYHTCRCAPSCTVKAKLECSVELGYRNPKATCHRIFQGDPEKRERGLSPASTLLLDELSYLSPFQPHAYCNPFAPVAFACSLAHRSYSSLGGNINLLPRTKQGSKPQPGPEHEPKESRGLLPLLSHRGIGFLASNGVLPVAPLLPLLGVLLLAKHGERVWSVHLAHLSR